MSRSPARKYSPDSAALAGQLVVGRREGARLALHRLGDDRRDVQPDVARLLELPLDLVRVAELDEVDVLQERLEGDPELGLAHERQRAVRLSVEPPDGGEGGGLLGVEAGQSSGPLDPSAVVVSW